MRNRNNHHRLRNVENEAPKGVGIQWSHSGPGVLIDEAHEYEWCSTKPIYFGEMLLPPMRIRCPKCGRRLQLSAVNFEPGMPEYHYYIPAHKYKKHKLKKINKARKKLR